MNRMNYTVMNLKIGSGRELLPRDNSGSLKWRKTPASADLAIFAVWCYFAFHYPALVAVLSIIIHYRGLLARSNNSSCVFLREVRRNSTAANNTVKKKNITMGCCLSCLEKGGSSSTETEMSAQQSAAATRQLSIARTMTQPTISIEPGGTKVSGFDLYHLAFE